MSTHIILLFIIHLIVNKMVCSIQTQIIDEKFNGLEQTDLQLIQGNKKINHSKKFIFLK